MPNDTRVTLLTPFTLLAGAVPTGLALVVIGACGHPTAICAAATAVATSAFAFHRLGQ